MYASATQVRSASSVLIESTHLATGQNDNLVTVPDSCEPVRHYECCAALQGLQVVQGSLHLAL